MTRPRKLTQIEEAEMYSMYKNEVSITEIAYTFKVSSRTVDRVIKRSKELEKKELEKREEQNKN